MIKKTYIIAEIGNTHEGSLGLAKCFIKSAADCGVDAVKMQTHIFEAESLPSAPNPPYFKDETRKEYFERTAFTFEQWKELKRYSEEDLKIDFFSSPFSLEALDLLEAVGMNTYKVASGEVNNTPLVDLLGEFDTCIAVGDTTAALDAYLSGLNVMVFLVNGELNLSPLKGFARVDFVRNSNQLNKVLELYKNKRKQLKIKQSYYWLDKSLPKWNSFLNKYY